MSHVKVIQEGTREQPGERFSEYEDIGKVRLVEVLPDGTERPMHIESVSKITWSCEAGHPSTLLVEYEGAGIEARAKSTLDVAKQSEENYRFVRTGSADVSGGGEGGSGSSSVAMVGATGDSRAPILAPTEPLSIQVNPRSRRRVAIEELFGLSDGAYWSETIGVDAAGGQAFQLKLHHGCEAVAPMNLVIGTELDALQAAHDAALAEIFEKAIQAYLVSADK